MTSTRPVSQQLVLDFSDEADSVTAALELQQEQSSSAAMEKSALDSVSMDLMEKIVDDSNMERAWKKVKANRGAPGPDGVTLDEFFETFRHQWPEVRRQLLEGTYQPGPARRKSIPKPDGRAPTRSVGRRDLGIPNVVDRRPTFRVCPPTSHLDGPHSVVRSGLLRIELRVSTQAFGIWSDSTDTGNDPPRLPPLR